MDNENNLFEKVSTWLRNSVMLKLLTITILMLLLLIPSAMINDVISERQNLQQEAITEVSGKWANSQEINGPILTIPLLYEYEKEGELIETIVYQYILPQKLNIDGKLKPQVLNRGIYDVVVYDSDLIVNGTFNMDFSFDENHLKEIQYDKAFLTIGFSDLRGIGNNINFKWGEESLKVESGSKITDLISSGITIYPQNIAAKKDQQIDFNFTVALQGSQDLMFVPVGGTTHVNLKSEWSSPSFKGSFLPKNRDINEAGFIADWNVLELNRNYPQSWSGRSMKDKMDASAFGVNLLNEVDDYKKAQRSAKYSVMTIALTFLVFFLVEVINKKRIHPFQYILVGLALSLFYILLVSISEHSNFNLAYAISTFGIVGMISLYALYIIKARKLVIILILTLIGIYGFVYVTLQLADYSLLIGSIGLSVILGLTMYFTRKIDWYNLQSAKQEKLADHE
ncbi:cell envelope integrity protein CreD [Marivirga tractuosa]|uniref:Inner membrane CreD family protein n=1 Tax=Marivirga tractuosa (strain ATCC 23168 / DSM 4126 / NBRC 15989 / NCIMB 1408 / VKM B-1430 / H-43) TaxID=643867 RepID=E4TR90_MARTH|nr:cell envelope integrity protein CreD [Marivirga tractuosa]ADR23742.1 Inner membrane CreD family protein [Marivirga tractuosa DSM 4126]BDD15577.1 cell envelope integrity protein CreD [Marivirga tractuosa]